MVWGESLTNPMLKFTDLKGLAKIAKEKVRIVRSSLLFFLIVVLVRHCLYFLFFYHLYLQPVEQNFQTFSFVFVCYCTKLNAES